MAEGILQEKAFRAGLNWSVESAGTNHYHTGEAPHPLSIKVAGINGVDISRQRARRFSAEDFLVYDRIYALANDVLRDIKRIAGKQFVPTKIDLLMNAAFPGQQLDVPDPWYGPEPGYHETFRLIDKCCDAVVENYLNGQKKDELSFTHSS
jgi:protein-tyrosine phosphatase